MIAFSVVATLAYFGLGLFAGGMLLGLSLGRYCHEREAEEHAKAARTLRAREEEQRYTACIHTVGAKRF
jgi:hypothetical protein